MTEHALSSHNSLPIVLIGGGGHASVVAEILLQQGKEIIAIVSPESIAVRPVFKGIEHLTRDGDVTRFSTSEVKLVNGVGMLPKSLIRQKINGYYLAQGYQFDTVIAPSAVVSPYATLEQGTQIFAGAIVQTGAVIGAHSIINSKALVEHDCVLGEYNHIAPGATMCGQVRTKSNVFVGAGAVVTHNITIGDNAIVGAGSCITRSIDAGVVTRPAATNLDLIEDKEGRRG
ncbi:acetyltransferase [Alteromonas sp. D210916BOD_24]|uniref:acetyltransferase n=1 Tax=Alteromonas sp. D210916BOD_24 TaxID=3157618 RepID=UPI00399CD901